MADGLTTTTTVATIPNATKIATDDAGAAGHVQMVKLAIATDGSATALTADNTDGLLVNLGANNDVTVTSGSVTATQGTATNLKAEVIGTGTFAVQATLAAGAATIAKAEDAASNDLDVGVPALAVRKATPANTSGTDGDYEFLQMSAGRLWTSATVDAALPAGANAIGKLAANSGVDIGDVDVTSVTPGTTASSLGKAEDAGHTTGDVGVMALAVRLDTGAAIAGTDGDYSPLQVDASGALRVTGGGGGTEYTEDAVAPADPVGTTLMMTRDDQLATVTEAEGDWSRARGTSKGALWVAIPDTNGDPITSFGGGTQYTEADTDATITGTAILWEDAADTLRAVSSSKPLPVDTELPAAAALADNTSTPTAPAVGAFGMVYDGATWDFQRGTSADGALVNLGANNDVINAGTFAVQESGSALTALQLIDDPVFADDGSFTVGTSKVSAIGVKATAHGAAPDAADDGDAVIPLANRHRIPFVLGGHPKVLSATYLWTASTTDDNVLPAISTGTKYAITRITVTIDQATTVGVAVRLGFGTASVPALPSANADAVDDILFYHPGLVPGSGAQVGDGSGILGVGADGAELRITAGATTSGTGVVTVTYFTIES